jgi:uncharacterized protein (TIGR03067 family)
VSRLTRTSTGPTDREAGFSSRKILDRLEDCWDEPALPEHLARTDLENLQGVWVALAGRHEAELYISGFRYTARFADGAIYMGTFELRTEGQPRTMEMSIDEGPARYKGQSAVCIYEVDGTLLRWCTAGPGRKDAPPAFPNGELTELLCFSFRRE